MGAPCGCDVIRQNPLSQLQRSTQPQPLTRSSSVDQVLGIGRRLCGVWQQGVIAAMTGEAQSIASPARSASRPSPACSSPHRAGQHRAFALNLNYDNADDPTPVAGAVAATPEFVSGSTLRLGGGRVSLCSFQTRYRRGRKQSRLLMSKECFWSRARYVAHIPWPRRRSSLRHLSNRGKGKSEAPIEALISARVASPAHGTGSRRKR